MSISYCIHPRIPLLHTTFSGVVTDKDLKSHRDQLRADPWFEPEMNELIDLRGVTKALVSYDAIVSLAHTSIHPLTAVRAVVAPTQELFGLARTYQMARADSRTDNLAIFRYMPHAVAWLGLSELDAEFAVIELGAGELKYA